jgi:hypothetical protein
MRARAWRQPKCCRKIQCRSRKAARVFTMDCRRDSNLDSGLHSSSKSQRGQGYTSSLSTDLTRPRGRPYSSTSRRTVASLTDPEPVPVSRPSAIRAGPFEPSLPSLSRELSLIPKGHLSATMNFITDNPEVLKEQDTLFLMDALRALKAGLLEHSESCGEKAILIRMCSELSSEGRRELLEDLPRTTVTPEQRKFEKKCSETYERLTNLADSQKRVSVPSDSGPDTISGSDGYKSGDRPSFRRNITGTQGAFIRPSGPTTTQLSHTIGPISNFLEAVYPRLSLSMSLQSTPISISRGPKAKKKN